jgi:hypothetical protein
MPQISLSENKLLKAWWAGCARSIFISLVLLIILFGVLLGLVILVFLVPIPNDQHIYFLMGGFFLILFLMITCALLWGVWSINRHSQKLDAALLPLGLTGDAYMLNGRQYHGILNGRQADVYFYRGPSLDIYIASPLNTRLGIGLKGPKNHPNSVGLNSPELAINDPDLAHTSIYSLDEDWGRELLEHPLARAAILRLTALQPGLEFRNLLFQPEALHFQVHHINPGTITPENLRIWVYDLLDLIRIAESLPSPRVTAAASSLERKARLTRNDFFLPIVGISCGIIGLFTAILIVGLFLLIFFERGGF